MQNTWEGILSRVNILLLAGLVFTEFWLGDAQQQRLPLPLLLLNRRLVVALFAPLFWFGSQRRWSCGSG
jgi:hypothetical protein